MDKQKKDKYVAAILGVVNADVNELTPQERITVLSSAKNKLAKDQAPEETEDETPA